MRNLFLKLYFFLFLVCVPAIFIYAEYKIIPMRVLTIGPEIASRTRLSNIEKAVLIWNQKMEKQKIKIALKGEFFTGDWRDYTRRCFAELQSKQPLDIFITAHEEIANFVRGDYLLDLTDRVKKDPKNYNDIFPSLWQSVLYQGKIYGIPQDTEVRMIYYRKDILKKMGWTTQQIEEFPKKIENGTILLSDIVRIAKEAQDKKLVQWGIFHRPSKGVNFFHFLLAFGGRLEDKKTGKLFFDTKAGLLALQFFYDLTHTYKVTPKEMTDLGWAVVDKAIPKGEILFNITGGSWNKTEMIFEQNMEEKEFQEKVGFALIPAGKKGIKAHTISHPLVYVIPKHTPYPDIAYEIIMLANAKEQDLIHAIHSSHLAVRKSTTLLKEYQKDPFISQITPFLYHTYFVPNHPKILLYQEIFFQFIRQVETNSLKPEKALEMMIEKLKKEIGDEIIIQ